MISPGSADPFTATLYVMNSGSDLYMGITINDDEFSTAGTWLPSGDSFVINFDDNLSTSLNELNNNVLGLSAGLPQFEDRHIFIYLPLILKWSMTVSRMDKVPSMGM